MNRWLLLAALLLPGCALDPIDSPDAGDVLQEDPMAGPLFVRVPKVRSAFVFNADSGEYEIAGTLCEADAATLIERVLFATHESNDSLAAGQITFLVSDGANAWPVKHYIVPAHDETTAGPLSGEIRMDLVLETGWSLLVIHTIKQALGGDTIIAFTAQGGELG